MSTTVSYEDANKTVKLSVETDFAAGDQIVVSGLKLANFGGPGATSNLWLEVANDDVVSSTDDRTKTVVAPTFTGSANQIFTVGDPSTAMTSITVTDDGTAATITAANDLRIRIPAALNMVWNTSITTATIGGGGAARVSTTVSYEDAGKTLVLNVTSDFAAGDQITVSGLQFTSFTAASAATALQLVISGAGGLTAATSDRTKTIYTALAMASAADQIFVVGAGATNISQITITEDGSPSITAANDIRIRIPATLNMTWDPTDLSATLGGGAAGKVSTTVTLEDGNKTLVLNVTSDFAAGDQLLVSGLRFASFTAVSPPDRLQLALTGSGGSSAVTDTRTKTITGATISSAANQVFTVGAAATTISPITITDAATATISAKKDIRVHIPTSFNMVWDATVTTATITGTGAAKVSTTVSYEDANKTLVVNVTTNFAANDQIVVAGLKYTSFTATSGLDRLWLETGNDNVSDGSDDKTIRVSSAAAASVTVAPDTVRVSRLPSNGATHTVDFTVANTGTASDSYDLLTTRSPGTALTVASIGGIGVTQGANPDSARLASLASGATATVTVTYAVASVAAGTTDTLFVRARSVGTPTVSDTGRLELTVVRAALTLGKAVSPSGTSLPGTDLTYTVTFTNAGSADASTVILDEPVPTSVHFKVSSVVSNMPTGVAVAVEYSNDGGSTWTYVPTSGGCSAPAGYDGCVNRVRWRLLNGLVPTAPDNTGNVQFVSRIR
jgi:uncharacterized repeat protein (TIGR01451 family)